MDGNDDPAKGLGGTRHNPPKGYRLLKKGEVIPHGHRLVWACGRGPWVVGGATSVAAGALWDGPEGIYAPVAVRVPKSPRKTPKLQETSLQAKDSQKDKAPLDREIVLKRLRRFPTGATCDRLEVLLGMSHQTASARINDLMRAGKIVDSGRREKTRTGRPAICWKVVG